MIWMSSFQNIKEIENPTVGSKVMALGWVLMRFLTLILTYE